MMRFTFMLKLLIISLFIVPSFAFSQQKHTVSGYIKDATNGEALIGATIYVKSLSTGTTTNVYGFFSLTLQEDEYQLDVSYIGYATQSISLTLNENTRLDIELEAEGKQLQEVIVSSAREQEGVKALEMSTNRLDINTIIRIPTFLGEADVIKSLLQLPGVQRLAKEPPVLMYGVEA
jgi:CarboxypepD_reg-like domain